MQQRIGSNMKSGGCDKTQEMIDEWDKQVAPLKEEYGAGFEATKGLVRNYVKDTPGAVRTIKKVMRAKYKRKLL